MKILKLSLENFQGIKKFEINADGKNCSIYGDNATGKSTVYNAFTWLMYGKPSTGEKNYTPKTVGSHNRNHIVELTLEMDNGSQMVFKKDFHEVYKTVKGNAQAVFSGHTTDYSVDGVPVNETQFKKAMINIYKSEELAKMLTMYDYFLENMKVSERRKILLSICGNVDFKEIVKSDPELKALSNILKKYGDTEEMYTVEEYQAIASKEKKFIDNELKSIPSRIDEAIKAKDDILESLDEDSIRIQIKSLYNLREQVSAEKEFKTGNAASSIRQQISEIKSKMADAKAEYVKIEADKNQDTYKTINSLQYQKSDLEIMIMKFEQDIAEHEARIKHLNNQRESLLIEYKEEAGKVWNGKEICPTCKRPLPKEEIDSAIETFNISKAKKLEEINRRGMEQCSKSILEAQMSQIDNIKNQIDLKINEKSDVERNIELAQKQLIETVDYSATQEYKEFKGQVSDLEQKLTDMTKVINDEEISVMQKLHSIDEQIEIENKKLAQFEFIKKQDLRIKELETKEKELASQYESIQFGIYLCELYIRKQAELLDEKINSRFKTLKFRLFIEQQNGGITDDCEAMIPCESGLVPFKSANNAARINAGLEFIDALSAYYKVKMPVFVDNAESITSMQQTKTQLIRLVVSKGDKTLRFERGDI